MSRDLIETGLGWSWTPRRVQRAMRDRATNVVVAEQGARLAGFAIATYFDERAHLMLFAVDRRRQRQGIGRALWAWLVETMHVAGISSVTLEVRARNTGARDFYRALGFSGEETLRGYYRGIEAAVRMECRIAVATPSSHG